MRIQFAFPIKFAILMVFVGLACNPISSLTQANSTPTNSPLVSATNQAVVGSSSSPTTAAPLAPIPSERVADVNALYVVSGTPATGGMSPVEVRIRPSSPPGQLRVGFLEGEVGGTGPQWHAAGWQAVMIASMLAGVDPTQYEFTLSVGGRIDGPSAGGLMTVGVMAALLGETPRSDAAMTGTINPDGTIGPVGGIPQKIQGAAQNGKKLVLVPLGQRYDQDENTKQQVDVVAEGKSLGMDVREVANIYDAYALIVGKPFPRPSVTSITPEFPTQVFDALKVNIAAWGARYQKERTQFTSLPVGAQQAEASQMQTADQAYTKANDDLGQGLVGLAYFEITEATAEIRKVNAEAALAKQFASGGAKAAFDYIKSMGSDSELKSALDDYRAKQPRTASDVVGMFDGYSDLGAAQGLLVGAQGKVDDLQTNLPKLTQDQALSKFMDIADDLTVASNYVQIARDALQFETGLGTTAAPSTAQVASAAETLRRAGEANQAMFDSVSIPQLAQAMNLTTDQTRSLLSQQDDDYNTVLLATVGEDELGQLMGNGMASEEMVFGNSQNIYAYSSGLIAKYYSLGAQLDQNFHVTSFTFGKALGAMLDFADQRARELISLCGNDVPVPAILYYENAHELRQGSSENQLTALNYYWQAVVLAQAEAFMAGKFSSAASGAQALPTPAAVATSAAQPTSNSTAVPMVELPTLEPLNIPTAVPPTGAAIPTSPSGWSVQLAENFDTNDNGWNISATQPDKTDYGSINESIGGGRLHLEASALKGVNQKYWPKTLAAASEEMVSTDARRVSGPTSVGYGILFRQDAQDNFYMFEINDDGQFRVLMFKGDWSTLADWTQSSAIRAGQVNHLAVTTQGSHFTFFVNGQQVAAINDTTIAAGIAGVEFDLDANTQATLEFSKFVVQTK